ncbi:leucine-rich repeat and IQ domain-containing protein 4 [Dromaius novaehollandiae]|uniref:leucine-rich repeat and IQ domain-containing protein 4 n=1 Tax=Dromaius novaehollandiae TaxID=8790 RepID=UPI00312024F7
MAESQQSQKSSKWSTHYPKGSTVRFENNRVQTAQEIPVNEVPEKEALSPMRVTDRIFFIDLANKQQTTIPPEVLRLEDLEELHMEKNLIESIPRDINHLRNMRVLYLDQNHIQDICEELGELKCLRSLDLSNNPLSYSSLPVISKLQALRQLRLYKVNLHEIPVQICKYLHHVELLGLSDNNLKCLPKELVNLTQLREIYLQKNRFESFPMELCHMVNLEIIDLEQNLVSLIPEEVGSLTNLVKLFLAFNNLFSIPDTLQHCQKLAVLDLSHNLLHKLPQGLKNLTEMEELGLSGNNLEKLPHEICSWMSLSLVYLRNTGLHTVPKSFTRLTSVRILDLSENCFSEIPKSMCAMKNLEILALDDNQIHKIPVEVKELANLKCLGLSGNQFSIFPKEIFLLESLERLYLGQDKGIKFISLPGDIRKLQNLKELHIENNHLECLPLAIGFLTHLEILDCRNNCLKRVPDSICQIQGEIQECSTSVLVFALQPSAFLCSALQKLLLQNNQLHQLPEDLDTLQQLELVLVDGNPMTDPPMEVCCQGTFAILEYLQEKRRKKAMILKVQNLWHGLMNRKGIGSFLILKKLIKPVKKGKKGKEKGKENGKEKGGEKPAKGAKAKK